MAGLTWAMMEMGDSSLDSSLFLVWVSLWIPFAESTAFVGVRVSSLFI